MKRYHKYVFNTEKRKFVGEFERMYQGEAKEGFDSWHQEDHRNLSRKIVLSILQDYNFDLVIDIGCGKGACTHFLKKKNNKVIGVDISKTALEAAEQRYPDIDFLCMDIKKTDELEEFLDGVERTENSLVVGREVFSYVENWKDVLEIISRHTRYFLVSLYIPEDPIGFVKSVQDFIKETEKHFEIIELVDNIKWDSIVILGRSKNAGF